jgi:hypothetical protein
MAWHPDTRWHIEDAFALLADVPDSDWNSLGLSMVAGDTGQPEMLEAKRRYASSEKGKAARAKHDAKRLADPAERERRAARERARRAAAAAKRRDA